MTAPVPRPGAARTHRQLAAAVLEGLERARALVEVGARLTEP